MIKRLFSSSSSTSWPESNHHYQQNLPTLTSSNTIWNRLPSLSNSLEKKSESLESKFSLRKPLNSHPLTSSNMFCYRHFTRTMNGVAMVFMLAAFFMAMANGQQDYNDPSPSSQTKKCTQYGHSCLGGHGKRSLSSSMTDDLKKNQNGNSDLIQKLIQQLQQKHSKPLSVPLYMYQNGDNQGSGPSSLPIISNVNELLSNSMIDTNNPIAHNQEDYGSLIGTAPGGSPMLMINPPSKIPPIMADHNQMVQMMLSIMVDPVRMQRLNSFLERLMLSRSKSNGNNQELNQNEQSNQQIKPLLERLRYNIMEQQQKV